MNRREREKAEGSIYSCLPAKAFFPQSSLAYELTRITPENYIDFYYNCCLIVYYSEHVNKHKCTDAPGPQPYLF
jgi:hypothetical protein